MNRESRTTPLVSHSSPLTPKYRRSVLTRSLIAILIMAALAATASTAAFAHDDEELEGNKLVVGFLYEPTYEGERNAVSLRVTKGAGDEQEESSDTGSDHHHAPEPVGIEGLQSTLQVEVTHVPSNVSKTMNLRPVSNDPGHYVADLIPTSPGHYRFRFFGTIEGELTDVTFDSMAGGGDFDDVQAASAIHFPEPVASTREMESAMRGLQTTVASLQAEPEETQDDSDGATATMAIIAIVLGAGGVVFGGVSLVLSMRNRK